MTTPTRWPSVELENSRRKLLALRELVNGLGVDGAGADVELARFLVVRSCGHVEFSFDESIACFVSAHSRLNVASYVRGGLFRGRNPKSGTMLEVLRRFDSEWAADFENFIGQDLGLYQRELDFLVDRRNKIAHGQSEGVTRRKALDLCDYAVDIADWLVDCFDPKK